MISDPRTLGGRLLQKSEEKLRVMSLFESQLKTKFKDSWSWDRRDPPGSPSLEVVLVSYPAPASNGKMEV